MLALARMATGRPVAVSVVAAALVLLGWTSWSSLPLDLLPDLQSPTIVVSIRSGNRPPAEMERLYGEQVEQRLFAVRGIREINQVARTGRLVATVVFDWQTDMDFSLVEVEKAIGPVRSDPDVDEALVRRFDPRQSPVVTLGLVAAEGGPDLAELRLLARRQVATALERLDGVAEARVTGGRDREVQVVVDRYRMDAHGLTLADLESRLRAANVDIDAGTLDEGNRVWLVRGLGRFRKPADVAQVVLRYGLDGTGRRAAVRVADIADVRLAERDITHLVRVDGREGVGLAVYKEAGTNTVRVSRTVRAALVGLEADLPRVELRVVADEAGLVEEAISDVQHAALIGIALSILVLIVFLRSAGPTLIVATAVPVSLFTTLFLMQFAGHSLNIMTLGGLALGAGMLVDNAIVVVEATFRRLARGEPPAVAAAEGTGEVAGAIASSTLTHCAVFLPIIFVQGLAARLVTGLAFTVVVSTLVSLAVAVLLVPALAAWLVPRGGVKIFDPGGAALERMVARLLTRPGTVVVVATLAAVASVWSLTWLGTELLPPSDPRQLAVRLVGPPGQRVEATAHVVEAVEQVLRQAAGSDAEALLSEVGRLPEDDRLIREEQTEENTARVVVRLARNGKTAQQVVAATAPVVAGMGNLEVSWEIGASALARALGTTGPPVVVEILGQSLSDLREAAGHLRDSLAARPELWNVRSSFEGGPPELRVVPDRTLSDGMGVDLDTLAATLEAALDGRKVTVLAAGDEERDVVLRLPRVRRDELLALPLATKSGLRCTVGDVARLVPEEGAREIFRRDQRRVARVTARIAPSSDFPAALDATRAALAATELPPGLRLRLAGEEEERARTFGDLSFAGALAVLLIFMVLAATFESLVHPLTVVAAVPLALIGVAMILLPLGRPIGVMEMLGLIVLSGVAVNDAILLITAARDLIEEGLEVPRALARAASIRLRPILMTTLTTTLALVPLAFGTGEAARLRSPMALTVIGGMVSSTIGSLAVIPCLYLLLERLRPRAWRRGRTQVQARAAEARP